MSNLKSTVKACLDYSSSEAFTTRTWAFVFSSDIKDWQYNDSTTGKKRRAKADKIRIARA